MPNPKPRDPEVIEGLRGFHQTETNLWYDQYLRTYRNRETNAPARGIRWQLNLKNFWHAVITAEGRCQVTGQPFDRYTKGASGKRPFLPSLDRVDSHLGYESGNIEFTTVIVNLAINDFGRDVFFEMLRHGITSDKFGEYIQRTEREDADVLRDHPRFLSNMMSYITDNPVARLLIRHFLARSHDEAS
jgi:hypothetical protein